MNRGNRIGELMLELREMPQYELIMSLEGFDASIFTFDKNFSDLESLIRYLTTDPKAENLHALKNRDQLHEFLAHIIRALHNFVAAAQSLIDHTGRLHRKLYAKTANFEDYQARVDQEFAKDPMAHFVKGLRQYCQHYKAPNLIIETFWDGGDSDVIRTVYLPKEDLLSFGSWTTPAKEFLEEIEEKVNLLEVAAAYRRKLLDFYDWFQIRQMQIHAPEIEEFRVKETELLILILEQKIDSGLVNKGLDMPQERDEIFLSIFSSNEFAELETLPIDSPKRPQRAVELLRRHLPISEDLRNKIYRWYEEIGSEL